MHCPLCGTSLREIEYEGVHVHTCDDCGGECIGPDQLAHVVRIRQERFAPEVLSQIEGRAPTFGLTGDGAEHRSLCCPSCSGAMRVVNYSADSGIYMDRCEDCGTMFLDHEELEKIQALMERWGDEAPEQIRAISAELERARRETAEATSRAFAGSRFAFVNALVNRMLDAA